MGGLQPKIQMQAKGLLQNRNKKEDSPKALLSLHPKITKRLCFIIYASYTPKVT